MGQDGVTVLDKRYPPWSHLSSPFRSRDRKNRVDFNGGYLL